ncbi:MAG: MBL fold metallo-hydrolase [bacterium]
MEIGILASGSKGNAALVRANGAAFLVDAGLSGREIGRRLAAYGVSPADLLGIVLTHEHVDHTRGVGVLSRRWDLPVWSNRATRKAGAEALGALPRWREIEVGVPFEMAGVRLTPFSTPHDAADPFGLILESEGGYRVGLATDMGYPTQLARERLQGLQGLVLEFNHELDLLLSGPYPWHVKQRIRGKLGHLNNVDAAGLLGEVASADLEWVVCAHISEENNKGDLILERARAGLAGRNGLWDKSASPALRLASQHEPTPILGPGGRGDAGGRGGAEEALP